MKFVLLKKVLSYFMPILEKRLVGEHHPILEVSWNNGNLWLNTAEANYSYGSLHEVFKKAFQHFSLKISEINSVLILGFGAGSVKSILRKNYHYCGKIIGIEYDEQIIKLAHQYFNVPNNNNRFTLLHTDACTYLNETKNKFDLIVIDLFKELIVPEEFLKKSFFEKLIQCKSKNGCIIFNVINNDNKIINSLTTYWNELGLKNECFTLQLYGTKNNVYKIF